MLERLRVALGGRADPRAVDHQAADDDVERLRAWLDERLFEPATMADAARRSTRPPPASARSPAMCWARLHPGTCSGGGWTRRAGGQLDGRPIADVAAEVGFADQAHHAALPRPPGHDAGAVRAGGTAAD